MAFNGQSGPEDSIGGISADVRMDATPMDADMARVKRMLDDLEAKFVQTGASAAASTARIDAGMDRVGKSAGRAGYGLQVFGQTLDDLQYVGEQGLRPILNNIMQMSPALGIAVLAIDQFYKHSDRLEDVGKRLAEAFDVDFKGFTEGEASFRNMETTGRELVLIARNFKEYVESAVPAWKELLGIGASQDAAAVKAFVEGPTDADKKRGKAVADAIKDYGGGKFLQEMVDPALREPGNEDSLRREQRDLLDLVARAAKGDRAATAELEERTAGKGVGTAIRDNLPGVRAGRKAEEDANAKAEADRVKKWQADMEREKTVRDKARADMLANEEADARDNDANYQKYLKDKVKNREALTAGERASAPPELVAKELDLQLDDAEKLNRMGERGSDLNWRLQDLMNPERQGQTMGGESYTGSFHSTTGLSEEAKRLRAIQEVMEEIRDNDKNIKLIGVRRR